MLVSFILILLITKVGSKDYSIPSIKVFPTLRDRGIPTFYSLANLAKEVYKVHDDEAYINSKKDKDELIARYNRHFGVMSINEKVKVIMIALRGTVDGKDWTYNLKAYKTEITLNKKKLSFHTGFYLLGRRVMDEIYRMLQRRFKNLHELRDYQVYFTGHSLGGALCQVVSWLMYENSTLPFYGEDYDYRNQFKITTFGAPRAFGYATSFLYPIRDENHYRIYSNLDVVPKAPSERVGFRHTGTKVKLQYEYVKNFWQSIWNNKQRLAEKFAEHTHSMEKYAVKMFESKVLARQFQIEQFGEESTDSECALFLQNYIASELKLASSSSKSVFCEFKGPSFKCFIMKLNADFTQHVTLTFKRVVDDSRTHEITLTSTSTQIIPSSTPTSSEFTKKFKAKKDNLINDDIKQHFWDDEPAHLERIFSMMINQDETTDAPQDTDPNQDTEPAADWKIDLDSDTEFECFTEFALKSSIRYKSQLLLPKEMSTTKTLLSENDAKKNRKAGSLLLLEGLKISSSSKKCMVQSDYTLKELYESHKNTNPALLWSLYRPPKKSISEKCKKLEAAFAETPIKSLFNFWPLR